MTTNPQTEYSAYPLSWPTGWPRTREGSRQESRFLKPVRTGYGGNRRHSIDEARSKLFAELTRLGAREVVVSSNLVLRLDGMPRSGQPNPTDSGVAVYFELKGKAIVLPCDKWKHAECNLWAVACHIESLRGQERWGVGSVEQAFAGYMALPEKRGPDCWEALGFKPDDIRNEEAVLLNYRELTKSAHPDAGGSEEAFRALCEAKDIALATLRGGAR